VSLQQPILKTNLHGRTILVHITSMAHQLYAGKQYAKNRKGAKTLELGKTVYDNKMLVVLQ
jgi:hypothetical protein